MAEKKSWLIVRLGENGRHEFQDPEHVRSWLERDRQAWDWTPKETPMNVDAYHGVHPVTASWPKQWAAIDEALVGEKPDVDEVAKVLRRTYGSGSLIHHESPRGRFVHLLREEGHNNIASILIFLQKGSFPAPSQTANTHQVGAVLTNVISAFSKMIFAWSPSGGRARLHHFEAQAQGITETLAKMQAQYGNAISQAQLEMAKEREAHELATQKLISERSRIINEQEKQLRELRERIESRFNTFMTESKEKYTTLETFFREELSLEASIGYWSKARSKHLWSAAVWGAAFGLGAISAIGSIIFYWDDLLKLIGDDPSAGAAGILIAIASLVFWVLRMFSRMYLSSYHRAEDAGERQTMLQSYLALRSEEKLSEEHIGLVLSTIFRPGVVGVIKDETPPQLGPASWFAQKGSS